jgi:hypothetical protein
VIRLKDQCPGFEKGKENAVLQFYLLKNGSSINQGNYAQNLTIQSGKGNPGAVGMKWNASDWGGIYNVAIRSGDGSGRAGLMMDRRNAHGYQHDIVVDGFDVGVEMAAGSVSHVVLEYATLSNQREVAVRVSKNETFCGRKLLIRNAPMALRAAGSAHVVLLDCEALSEKSLDAAISVEGGHLLARDIRLSGFASAVAKDKQPVVTGDFIDATRARELGLVNRIVPAVVRDLGRSNLHVIDGRQVLQDLDGLTTDLLHPSDECHMAMGGHLATALRSYLPG